MLGLVSLVSLVLISDVLILVGVGFGFDVDCVASSCVDLIALLLFCGFRWLIVIVLIL